MGYNTQEGNDMDNTIYMFGIPLFTCTGYCDLVDDGTQHGVAEWYLEDLRKYNGNYAVVGFDGSLKIFGDDGEEVFEGSLLDSEDFREKLKNKI